MKPIQFDKSALHLVQTKSPKLQTTAALPAKEASPQQASGLKSLLTVIHHAPMPEHDTRYLDDLKSKIEQQQYQPELDDVAKLMLPELLTMS